VHPLGHIILVSWYFVSNLYVGCNFFCPAYHWIATTFCSFAFLLTENMQGQKQKMLKFKTSDEFNFVVNTKLWLCKSFGDKNFKSTRNLHIEMGFPFNKV
jgi:hypothetical protein